MSGTWAIFRKELRIYFVSPQAYAFLCAFLFLAGLFFYLGIALTGEASLRVMLGNLAISLIFVLPMLTMGQLADEQRGGTLELLMTAPLSLSSLILGKWLASVALCVVMLSGTLLFPGILGWYGEPDWGVVFTSYVGLLLCCGAFCAAGLFASSLTDDQVAGGLVGILLLLPFWLMGSAANLVGERWRATLEQLALLPRLRDFNR
ncbi:MAG: ABC transporter permease, partial [Myxococcota bacterium]|nr:ABC transporter permease [Myxococcota bacterium]